jgi:hypothetical protein
VLRDRAGIGVRFPRSQPSLGNLPAIYREAKRTVEAWGGRIHLVYMPTLRRYRSWLGEPILGRHELLRAAAELGIPLIDLEPSFRATGEPQRLWLPGGHLNAAGYSLAAERITAEVSD